MPETSDDMSHGLPKIAIPTTKSWWMGVGVGLALFGGPSIAKEWSGTIGEPLGDSTPEAIALVDHLNKSGAQFFGSWRCPACFRQMSLFGKQAGAELNYIECGKPEQLPEQYERCQAAQIRAVPTWTLPNSERREGVQQLKTLAEWSGMN